MIRIARASVDDGECFCTLCLSECVCTLKSKTNEQKERKNNKKKECFAVVLFDSVCAPRTTNYRHNNIGAFRYTYSTRLSLNNIVLCFQLRLSTNSTHITQHPHRRTQTHTRLHTIGKMYVETQ